MTPCVCAGEAKVHDCLRKNLDKISDACRKEEISLSVLQASNTELMPNIANACKVIAASSRAHHCTGKCPSDTGIFILALGAHRTIPAVHALQTDFNMHGTHRQEYIMLLQAERAAHCSDVRPGKARVFTCLLAHIESGDYRQGCRDQLSAQQARRVSDWRLDYDLRQACKDDVPKVGCPMPACRAVL